MDLGALEPGELQLMHKTNHLWGSWPVILVGGSPHRLGGALTNLGGAFCLLWYSFLVSACGEYWLARSQSQSCHGCISINHVVRTGERTGLRGLWKQASAGCRASSAADVFRLPKVRCGRATKTVSSGSPVSEQRPGEAVSTCTNPETTLGFTFPLVPSSHGSVHSLGSVLYSLDRFSATNFLPRRGGVPHFPTNVLSQQHPFHSWLPLWSASVDHSLKDPPRIGHSHGHIVTDLCCGRSPALLSETAYDLLTTPLPIIPGSWALLLPLCLGFLLGPYFPLFPGHCPLGT